LIKCQQNSLKQRAEEFAPIHKLINSVWNKEDLPEEWKESITVLFIRRAVTQLVVITVAYHVCQQFTKFYPASFCRGLQHMQGNISVDFDATDQLLIIYFAFI
jgi:hypothetical protein